jgi:hypothetical protein
LAISNFAEVRTRHRNLIPGLIIQTISLLPNFGIQAKTVQPERVVSHCYTTLSDLPEVFSTACYRDDFIKAALVTNLQKVN